MSPTPSHDELARQIGASSLALYRFARSLVRSDEAAADLVQEAQLRAFAARASFRGDASVLTWLRRIVHNLAIDRSRAPERELAVDDVEARWRDDDYTVDPAVVLERAERRDEIEDALARLAFIYRATIILHDIEGWTVAEIAEVTGASVPAVKQRLRRGRMLMVAAMARGAERRIALKGVPMRCWDARQLVSDYLDRALSDEQRHVVEAHLGSCPTCPPLYAALVGVHAGLGGLRDNDDVIPPAIRTRLTAGESR